MPHIRSCLLLAESAIVGGAALVALGRHAWYLRRGANYSLASALGSGAIGGLLGAAGGTALCVMRDGTSNPGGGWMTAWLFRLLPFGALGLIEGAVIGVVAGVAVAWLVSRRARRSIGG
jgi:hypothetical protein